jgi:hypothetical protein
MPRNEELLTGEQLAKDIKVTELTIERWRREGRIPIIWIGHRTIRYRLSDVVAALEQAANAPKAREIRAKHSERGRVRAKSLHAEMAVRRSQEVGA